MLKELLRQIRALKNSYDGFLICFKSEAAFRSECIIILPAFVLTFFLKLTAVEHVLLITSLLLVLITELLNTGIEALSNRVSLEQHELIKKAKDVGSAAVLLALFAAATTWGLILY